MHPDHVHVMPVQAAEPLGRDHLAGAAGRDTPVGDVHDPVHHPQQRVHVMRGKQHGDLVLAGQPAEQGHDLLLALQVEVRQRLVEQQQPRPADQRVRDQHPLLLAAGQFAHPRVGVVARADVGEGRLDQVPAAAGREAESEPVPVHTERHHVASAQWHVRVDDQPLRHVADLSLAAGVLIARHQDPAARRLQQPEDDAEQGRLSRAVGADEAGELALADGEADVAEHLAATEPHPDAIQRQHCRAGGRPPGGRRGSRLRLVLGNFVRHRDPHGC